MTVDDEWWEMPYVISKAIFDTIGKPVPLLHLYKHDPHYAFFKVGQHNSDRCVVFVFADDDLVVRYANKDFNFYRPESKHILRKIAYHDDELILKASDILRWAIKNLAEAGEPICLQE